MKISILGLGHVGSTVAYTLVIKGLATELVLVNRTQEKARGDALDLTHALSFTNSVIPIRAGSIAETVGSEILILCLSAPFQSYHKTRTDLAKDNLALYRNLIPELAKRSPAARVLVVTNPVDVMTFLTLKLSGFPSNRVMGIGTLIDSARFRMELSRLQGVHPSDLRAYVLGEHGETQFAAWSAASVGGERISPQSVDPLILQRSAIAGHEIMKAKGYTNFAVAMATALVVESVVNNSLRTIPVSVLLEDYFGMSQVCLSVPAVVGSQGVKRVLKPDLDAHEIGLFQTSAKAIQAILKDLRIFD